MKPTKKWLRMAEMYKRFAPSQFVKPINGTRRRVLKLTFSKKALQEMFEWESLGKGDLSFGIFPNNSGCYNGYALGKRSMDIVVSDWKKDGFLLPGITKYELKRDYPEFFLRKVKVLC